MGVRYDPNWNSSTARTAYGTVPDPTELPDRQAQLEALGVPAGKINDLLTGNAISDLEGRVSYQPSLDYSAALGIKTGLQGSEFARRAGAADYLDRVDAAKARGANTALNALSGITSTQTVAPETQIGLDQSNKQLAAAPDPQLAANAAINAYQNALNQASSYYSTPSQPSGSGRPAYSLSTPSPGAGGYSFPTPTAVGGLSTSDDPFNWSPTPQSTIDNWFDTYGGNSWNNLTNWNAGTGAGGNTTPAPAAASNPWGSFDADYEF